MKFSELNLAEPLLRAVEEQSYTTASPIQEQAIPLVLEGHDLMAAAQTGTGKTAAFALPILNQLLQGQSARANTARVLVLTPTRELAAQVEQSFAQYSKNVALKTAVVFGGVKINPQMMRLRKGVDVLVATPGRLLDLYQQNAVNFKQLEVLVLDEADRMLDMGFIHDIRRIIKALPKKRQTLMFSATFSDQIRTLAKGLVNNPREVSVSPRNTTASTVSQKVIAVDKKQKSSLLAKLIKDQGWFQVLVFTRTKHGANKLQKFLDNNKITAAAIHGNKSQGARTKALANFKQGSVQVLVATDIAARGLDIDQLPHVVNYDLPQVPEDYVHRIGRTGRAGQSGEAISLVSADEFKQLSAIENLIKKVLDREQVEGFDPVNNLPVSRLNLKSKKPKKPRQNQNKIDHRDGQRSGDVHRGRKSNSNNRRSGAQKSRQSSKEPSKNQSTHRGQ